MGHQTTLSRFFKVGAAAKRNAAGNGNGTDAERELPQTVGGGAERGDLKVVAAGEKLNGEQHASVDDVLPDARVERNPRRRRVHATVTGEIVGGGVPETVEGTDPTARTRPRRRRALSTEDDDKLDGSSPAGAEEPVPVAPDVGLPSSPKRRRLQATPPDPKSLTRPAGRSFLDRYTRDSTEADPAGHADPAHRERFRNRVGAWTEYRKEETGRRDELEANESPDDDVDGRRKRGKSKYTPLEEQFMAVKRKHADTLLMIECGYKYRFFGEDAEAASRTLRIYCHLDHNFMTASVPTHRLPYHLERLVRAGHKVGVVRQTETAALKKAGENRSGPFTRELSEVYTLGTLISDSMGGTKLISDDSEISRVSMMYIAAIYEMPQVASGAEDHATRTELVAVDVSTGELVYDAFEDDHLCQELEARLVSLEPAEIIVRDRANSKQLEGVVSAFCSTHTVRRQNADAEAFDSSVDLDLDERGPGESGPDLRSCRHAIAALRAYLSEFGLEKVMSDVRRTATRFAKKDSTSLSASVLRNFEVFANSEDGSRKGTLFDFLNRTSSPFGTRELKRWMCHPLVSAPKIRLRLDAVEELRGSLRSSNTDGAFRPLLKLMESLPDLEKSLPKIHYHRSSPSEFWETMEAFSNVAETIAGIRRSGQVQSVLLRGLLADVPDVSAYIAGHVHRRLRRDAAKRNDYARLFRRETLGPGEGADDDTTAKEASLASEVEAMETSVEEIGRIEATLDDHLAELRSELGRPDLEWKRIHLEEYLVELPVARASQAGADWSRINQTKSSVRFRTPRTSQLLTARAEHRERLSASATAAWKLYLALFAEHRHEFRGVVRFVSAVDVLSSLAKVAELPGYSKPSILEEADEAGSGLIAKAARHPVAESLGVGRSFVPNDIELGLGEGTERVVVVTGPNMGGKSTYMRTAAVLSILSQLGSFVPAASMEIVPFDSFYARIGAADHVTRGMSTFMVELSEAAEILRRATRRSFVAIDELGRGTSTHDGTAIAFAALEHILEELGCITLFVTHYPVLCSLAARYPHLMKVCYMAYLEQGEADGSSGSGPTHITFLYKLARGVAERSYGLHVARMAQLPEAVVQCAARQAEWMERTSTTVADEADVLFRFVSAAANDGEISEEKKLERLRALQQTH